MIPATELLTAGDTSPTWVRVTFGVTRFFGFGENGAAISQAREIFREAATRTAAYPIAAATVAGGTFVIDFRIQRTLSAGQFRDQFRDGFAVDVLDMRRLSRSDVLGNVPQQREALAVESEQTRLEKRPGLRDAIAGAVNVAKFVRGLVVLIVVGGFIFVAAPFIKQGAVALKVFNRARKRKG